jgi:Nif-specific regulatory protein
MLWRGHSEVAPPRLRPAVSFPVLPAAADGTSADTTPGQAVADPAHATAGSGAVSRGQMPDRDRFIAAMEKSGWVQAKAARILGLTPRQIGYALKKHGIEVKHL